MKSFKPISLKGIEEGRLVRAIDEDLVEISHALLRHVQKYGAKGPGGSIEAPKGSKVELVTTIAIEAAEDGEYHISSKIQRKLPGRPCNVTLAIHEQDDDDVDQIFVRSAGSSADSPRQAKLATDDGQPIDSQTGEIMEGKKAK